MPIGKTPIERYLLGEQTLEETKAELGIKLSQPFTEKQLNPVYKKSKKVMIPPDDKSFGTVSFAVTKEMRALLELSKKLQGRNMSNLLNCIVRHYYATAEHGIEENQ